MQVSIKEFKNNLSAYLKKVYFGEEMISTSHNHAIAKLVPLTGEKIAAKPDWSLFCDEINDLHQKLSKVRLKVSMRDTVIKQRNMEPS